MEVAAKKITSVSQLSPEQLRVQVPFEVVDLTDDERKQAVDKAVNEALQVKWNRLENDRKKRLAADKLNDAKRPWSPAELYQLAKWRATLIIQSRTGKPNIEFEPVDYQDPIVKALCLYFTNSPEFEKLDASKYNSTKLNFSLNKGIWLWGNPGVGKTLMMEMFNRNKRLCYDLVQCPKIAYQYVKHGDGVFENMISECQVIAPDASVFFQQVKGLCYNDLGTENMSANHYGNPINVMEYIMLQSYERKLPYWHRHVTTNLTFEQVKEHYGLRVLDRIKECFNILEVRGESLRK